MTQTAPPLRKFAGFVRPEKNYFPMPNEWIDICAEIDNLAELKIIQYVIRHTWGFQEYGIPKTISVDEFMYGRKRTNGTRMDNGTGLKSDRSVKDGIKAAIEHGYLLYEIDTSDPARMKKSYTLKMIDTGVDTTPQVDTTPLHDKKTGVQSTPLAGSIYPPGGYNLPLYQVDTTPRSEKDTIERHYKKDTEERHEREVADATARSQPSSQNDLSDDEDTVKKEVVHGDNSTHQRSLVDSPSSDSSTSPGRHSGTHNMVTHPPAPKKPPTNGTIPKRPRPQQQELKDTRPVESELSPEATAIMDKWDSVNKRPVPRTASVIEGATLLIPCNPTAEELDTCKKWLFTTDDPKKPWFRKIGVGLLDVAKNFSKWQSLQEVQPTKPPGKEESNEHKTSSFYSAQSVIERNKWKMEAFQAEYEAKTAAMQEVQS